MNSHAVNALVEAIVGLVQRQLEKPNFITSTASTEAVAQEFGKKIFPQIERLLLMRMLDYYAYQEKSNDYSDD